MGTIEKTFEYGDILVVEEGRYTGTVGIYDNDEETAKGEDRLVLYPGPIGISGYIMVPPNRVRKANDIEAARFKREYQEQAAAFRASHE